MAQISAQAVKALREQTGAGMMDCKRALADARGELGRAVELLRERGLAKAGKREGRATSEGTIGLALADAVGSLVEVACETDFVARTDDFTGLARSLAEAVAADGKLDTPKALLDASIGGETASDRIHAAIGKLGENVVVKRVARLAADGGVAGGYLHAGGKLGVVVALRAAPAGPELEALARDLAMHVAAADPTPVAVDRDGVPANLLESERAIYRSQAEQSGKPEKVIDRIVEGKLGKFFSDACLLEQSFVKDPDQSIDELVREVGKRAGVEIEVLGFERFKLGESGEE